ncbi:MAG: acyl-CoA desaturase [Myxococcales bacterium]|nr:acyl-CoA desaturase [Myxococcales bacterium]
MWRKTLLIFAAFWVSYLGFLASGGALLSTVLLAVPCGLALAGLGFSVMHDGGHGAYSSNPRVNKAMARVLDWLGGSSYIWRQKHNLLHHTYPNIVGADDDIDLGAMARLAPGQPRLRHHRFQHLYMWPLYGFISVKWHLIDDFRQLAAGRVGQHPFPRPKRGEAVVFWVGKAAFFTWALVVPILVVGPIAALVFYFVSQLLLGVTLAAVFQMAHCVEEADFLAPSADAPPVRLDWAAHQVATTVDFAPDNALATWYLGGLNFQVVHHLFPKVCHVHYPALARIVAETCAEHGITYRCTPTLRAALRSHYRLLRRLGQPEPAPVPVAA